MHYRHCRHYLQSSPVSCFHFIQASFPSIHVFQIGLAISPVLPLYSSFRSFALDQVIWKQHSTKWFCVDLGSEHIHDDDEEEGLIANAPAHVDIEIFCVLPSLLALVSFVWSRHNCGERYVTLTERDMCCRWRSMWLWLSVTCVVGDALLPGCGWEAAGRVEWPIQQQQQWIWRRRSDVKHWRSVWPANDG